MTAEALQNSAGALDPRRHVFRADLAAKSLEGTVTAERYVAGEPAFVVRASVPLRKMPDAARGFETGIGTTSGGVERSRGRNGSTR